MQGRKQRRCCRRQQHNQHRRADAPAQTVLVNGALLSQRGFQIIQIQASGHGPVPLRHMGHIGQLGLRKTPLRILGPKPLVLEKAVALAPQGHNLFDQRLLTRVLQCAVAATLRGWIARRDQHGAIVSDDHHVAVQAKANGADPVQRFALQVSTEGTQIFAGANQPVIGLKQAHIGDLVFHAQRIRWRIPAIARETLADRGARRPHQIAHDVVAGIVTVVPQRTALALRGCRQQNAGTLQIVDEEVAATVEKAQRPQGLDDQMLQRSRIAPPLFLLVERGRDLIGLIHLGANLVLEQGFGTVAQVFKVALDAFHLPRQLRAMPAHELRFHRLYMAFEQAHVVQNEIGAQHQRQGQHQDQ